MRAVRVSREQAILDEFMELLRIPNVAGDAANMRRNADAIAAMLQRRGLAPRLLEYDQTRKVPPVVYGEWKVPNAEKTLVLYAHYDGQPVERTEWASDPWTPTLRDGASGGAGSEVSVDAKGPIDSEDRLYARGAADDKAGVIVILSAIDVLTDLHRRPTDNLKLVFEGEEEAGSPHLADILTRHRALLTSSLWVVCDGPSHPSGRVLVTYGVRGDINVDLTVYGANRPLHSGHYGNWAPNPALRLARLLASMKDGTGHVAIGGWYDGTKLPGNLERRAIAASAEYDDTLRQRLGLSAVESDWSLAESATVPSLNINGMRSANVDGEAANVIPATATAVLDARLVSGNDPQRQFQKLVAHVRAQGYYVIDREPTPAERLAYPLIATMKLRPGGYKAARTPMDNPFAYKIVAAVRAASDQPIVELPTSGGSLPLSLVAQSLGAGAIVISIANYDDNQHAADENLRLQNLWSGIDLYAALITHGQSH